MTGQPPADRARALLGQLLATDFEGAAELRQQLIGLRVEPGCNCGCGTLNLFPPPTAATSTAGSPLPVGGAIFDEAGAEIGGLTVFLERGMLSALEAYSWDGPLPLPDPESVRWTA